MAETLELEVPDWVGRMVRRIDADDDDVLGQAIVLAVDDTDYAPTAWIKYAPKHSGRDCPFYRSIDLSNLEDVETGALGPRWGTNSRE